MIITIGIIIGIAILSAIVHVFRYVSKCNDEQNLIRMKRKVASERRNGWIKN